MNKVLGINERNHALYRLNSKEAFVLAKDKLATKNLLALHGIPVPQTYLIIRDHVDILELNDLPYSEFVIKPNKGSVGSGILVLKKKDGKFFSPTGKAYDFQEIRKHVKNILDGEYSGDDDTVLVEERIRFTDQLSSLPVLGLPDIRVICIEYKPVMAMVRWPTELSSGKANISIGAYGLAVDMETGRITNVHAKVGKVDGDAVLARCTVPVPDWEYIKNISGEASRLMGLGYSGVDIVLRDDGTVCILEMNGRSGLEIQNVNKLSLRTFLSNVVTKDLIEDRVTIPHKAAWM